MCNLVGCLVFTLDSSFRVCVFVWCCILQFVNLIGVCYKISFLVV